MTYHKLIFVILLLLNLLPSFAQKIRIKENKEVSVVLINGVAFTSSKNTISVYVRDSASLSIMPGADVCLCSEKDTLKASTDINGYAAFTSIPKADSLSLKVYFLGFKTAECRFKTPECSISANVIMQEDPAQLSEVIVSGDKISMVIKGDTTVFNAAAFNTAENAPLKNLLRQMPGIEIKDDGIVANGKPINKILINGSVLFGNDVKSALDIVYSRDVKNIKVYEQYDQTDYTIKDSLDRKERVLDIITKIPLDKIQSLQLATSISTGKGYSAQARGSYFEMEKPTISAIGNYDKSPGDLNYDSSIGDFSLNGSYIQPKKLLNIGYGIDFQTSYSKNRDKNITTFTPSELYVEKSEISEGLYKKGNLSLNGNIIIDKTFNRRRDRIKTTLNYTHLNHSDYKLNTLTSSLNASPVYFSSTNYSDTTRNDNLLLLLDYRHKFKKQNRSLSVKLKSNIFITSGYQSRIDSLKSSTYPTDLKISSKDRNGLLDISGTYTEPLTQNINASFGLTTKLNNNLFDKDAFDRITDSKDLINSASYSNNTLSNNAHLSLIYRKGGFSAYLSAHAQSISTNRTESIPANIQDNRSFNHISPSLELNYESTLISLKGTYTENQQIPSLLSLRNQIDNSNLMHLTAGNPDLKQSIIRHAQASFSIMIPKLETSLSFCADGSITSDYISTKILYFSAPTTLPKYKYTFPEGSDLRIPVNVDGKWNYSLNLSASSRIGVINTTLTPSINYSVSNTPYFKGEVPYALLSPSLSGAIYALCDFSDNISLNLYAYYANTDAKENGVSMLKTSNIILNGTLSFIILKRFTVFAQSNYAYMSYSNGFDPTENIDLSSSIEYRFGKEDKCAICISANNILNSIPQYGAFMRNDAVTNSISYALGRNYSLSFSWRIK